MTTSVRDLRHDGSRVAEMRNFLGFDQDVVAKRAGMEIGDYNEVENAAEISDDVLVPIARAMNVSVNDIRNFKREHGIYFANGAITANDNATNQINIGATINYNQSEALEYMFKRLMGATLSGKVKIPNQLKEEFEEYSKSSTTKKEAPKK